MHLLAEADRLEAVAQLVGEASLPDSEQVTLLVARLIRSAVLQQSALSPNDAYCGAEKGAALLSLVLDLHDAMLDLLGRGVPAARITDVDLSPVVRIRDEAPPDGAAEVDSVRALLLRRLEEVV
jgi:V/A-type H+-transporting ATPase subunit A